MTRALVTVAAGLAVLAAASAVPAGEREAIDAVLDDWHAAAAAADLERYFAHFAADAVFIGTDAGERWTLEEFRAFARPHFERGKAWSFTAVERHVSVSGDVAWFDERLDTPNLGPCRGSGVLVRSAGGWRIAHYVLSLAVPNEVVGEVRSLIDSAARPAPGPPPGD
jgi:ketosteroid isomerase-like protein